MYFILSIQWNKTHTHTDHVRNRSREHSSSHKGVSWNKGLKKWNARIRHGGWRHHLGYFAEEDDAAHAYADSTRSAMAHREAERRRDRGELGAWLEERKRSKTTKVFSR